MNKKENEKDVLNMEGLTKMLKAITSAQNIPPFVVTNLYGLEDYDNGFKKYSNKVYNNLMVGLLYIILYFMVVLFVVVMT